MPTREEEIIRRYFEAFNKHDLDGVIACFHPQPVVVDSDGRRHEGVDAPCDDCIDSSFRWQLTVDATSARWPATTDVEWRSHCFRARSIATGRSLKRSEPKCSSLLMSGSRKSATTIGS